MSNLLKENTNHFEQLRQQQETRNEKFINYIQMMHFGAVLFANVMTRFADVAPFRTSWFLISVFAISLLFRVGLYFYLRVDPPYYRARKYIISCFELVVTVVATLMLGYQGVYPWIFLNMFVISLIAMNTVLSGLRYSTYVVLFNGGMGLVLFLIFYPWQLSREFLLPITFTGCLLLSITTICMAYAVSSLIQIHREAASKEQLARFLPPELVEQVTKNPELLTRRTERRNATVLFTDIRGFTRFSEMLTPEQVVEFLNEFLEEMTAGILDHEGMLDKYIGDAVMGVFGVPIERKNHAHQALLAALDMRERLVRLNQRLVDEGLPELSIGIGLHTGDLLFGAIGSSRRLDYTVIGDTVNVASRIEGMTRSYPLEILLSDSTKQAIGDLAELHEIATVQVKNREEPLRMWSPDPMAEGAPVR